MDNCVKFSEVELFLIEMALDQALYTISDINSPIYKTFDQLDKKIYSLRVKANQEDKLQ